MPFETPLRAGVIGVGSMGENHVRVYDELAATELVGVHDVDEDLARDVADDYGVEALPMNDLLNAVDVVSVAVPTPFHHSTVCETLDAGVHTLVEKPFVDDPQDGRDLIRRAKDAGVVLQVGHIERFNPAVIALQDIVPDLDVLAIQAERLGPPLERDIDDTAVMDLMIHDVDIVRDLVGGEVTDVGAMQTAGGDYASAQLQFDSGVVAQLTASRVTQEKVRGLTISARTCRVKVDYIDQTIEIHRRSKPSYLRQNGRVHFHHEGVVEELALERDEPLKNELRSFVDAARTGETPVVSGRDGLAVVELTKRIDQLANDVETPHPNL